MLRVWTGKENDDGEIPNCIPLSEAKLPPEQALAFALCAFTGAVGCESAVLALPKDGQEHGVNGISGRIQWTRVWNRHGPCLWLYKRGKRRRLFCLD